MNKLILCVVLAACAPGATPQDTSQANAGGTATNGVATLVLTPSGGLVFGSTSVGATSTATATVGNSGNGGATQITDQSSGLGEFGYQGGRYPGVGGTCAATLPAGASCTLALIFAPTQTAQQQAILTLGYFDGKTQKTTTLALSGLNTVGFDPRGYTKNDAGVNAVVDALGVATTNSTGTSQTLSAHKAAADDAITIIALSSDPSSQLIVDEVTNPVGTMLTNFAFFDQQGDYGPLELNRATYSQGAVALMIPQTPDIDATSANDRTPAGTYNFAISAFDPFATSAATFPAANVSADVFVVHQPATSPRHIDVNLFFTGAPGPKAADALASAGFAQIIQTFVSLWGQGPGACAAAPPANTLGLCIDSINYSDLPPGFADIAGDFREDLPGQAKDMVELFEQSAGKRPAGVNFFFVDSIELGGASSATGTFRVLGLDGSIPAPGAFMGTPRSGALVVLDAIPSDAADIKRVGATLAHEGGHYLGLFHVQESDCQPDNLSDTPCDPACQCVSTSSSASAPHCTTYSDVALSQVCKSPKDPGFDTAAGTQGNVMFWAAGPSGSGGLPVFSLEQQITTRRHPLVHN